MLSFHQRQRLPFAFAISVLLHALIIGADDFRQLFSTTPRLPVATVIEARLLPLADIDPLIKDTVAEARLARPQPAAPPKPGPGATLELRERAVQRKLAEHLFYPPEAVSRGLEGEVRLLLTLDPQGKVVDARVASSSGHALLDRAAADAAFAMGSIAASGAGELILPVVFRLQ